MSATSQQLEEEAAVTATLAKVGQELISSLDTPVLLAPDTTYGVDVGMTSSTSAWQTGIPYINTTANVYSGGVLYSSGTSGLGTASMGDSAVAPVVVKTETASK